MSLYVRTRAGVPARLRRAPGTHARVSSTVAHGTKVRAVGRPVRARTGGSWYRVRHGAESGYLASSVLDRRKPFALRAGMPERLVIANARVRVDAAVEYVGQTPAGAMDVPKAWENTGWYEPGTRPGERGNAVIAGHLDSDTGPAVFWDLGRLRVGDQVSVIDVQGRRSRFRVSEMVVYYEDDAPIRRIFGKTDGAHLNLITCDGVFDRGAGEYDRRLVVYTDRVG